MLWAIIQGMLIGALVAGVGCYAYGMHWCFGPGCDDRTCVHRYFTMCDACRAKREKAGALP
jgi:hypothetical protein